MEESREDRKLQLKLVLTDEAQIELSGWWASLPAKQRARGRWCFHEPSGLPQPRQRVRYTLPVVQVPDLMDDEMERHNKTQIFKTSPGPHVEAWKAFALKTTNQVHNHVQEPVRPNATKIWLRVFQKSHTKLLRPGGLDLVENWQRTCTSHQRSALSDLFWNLNDYMTAKRGISETMVRDYMHRFAPIQCINCTASLLSSASFCIALLLSSTSICIACIWAPANEAFLC